MADNSAIQVVMERNAFYRSMHFLALATLSLVVLSIVVLLIVLYILIKYPTHPIYFATDRVSRLIKVIPVTVPHMTTDEVSQWTVKSLEKVLSVDFINYRYQFQSAQNLFTPYGWQKYIAATQDNGNLTAVITRKLVVVAKVVDKPIVVTEGLLGSAYAWKFQMYVLLTYRFPPFDEKSKFLNPLMFDVIVQRQDVLQSVNGLGIVQLVGRRVESINKPQEISGTSTT